MALSNRDTKSANSQQSEVEKRKFFSWKEAKREKTNSCNERCVLSEEKYPTRFSSVVENCSPSHYKSPRPPFCFLAITPAYIMFFFGSRLLLRVVTDYVRCTWFLFAPKGFDYVFFFKKRIFCIYDHCNFVFAVPLFLGLKGSNPQISKRDFIQCLYIFQSTMCDKVDERISLFFLSF
jgi:hypothetical protein